MKRIGQAEINLIFKSKRGFEYVRNWDPNKQVQAALARHPGIGLAAAFKFHLGRSGLTPFTMHYLTKSKEDLDSFTRKLERSRVLNYTYCYGTTLPVVTCKFRHDWVNPGTILMPSPRSPFYTRGEMRNILQLRDTKYDELKQQLSHDTELGLVDDEYMRRFGGKTIAKSDWQYLKKVAGLYL